MYRHTEQRPRVKNDKENIDLFVEYLVDVFIHNSNCEDQNIHDRNNLAATQITAIKPKRMKKVFHLITVRKLHIVHV